MAAEETAAARRLSALDIGANRQRRRVEALRLELAQRRAARERAQASCGEQQGLLDEADAVARGQRDRLAQMRMRRFSSETWLEGLRMLGLLDERRAEQAALLHKLDAACRQAHAQVDATSSALGAAQAHADLLAAQVEVLRKRRDARRIEREDEEAGEDAASRPYLVAAS